MADFNPFAAAGFAPAQQQTPVADPFAAAGFAPVQPPPAQQAQPQPSLVNVDDYGRPIYDNASPGGAEANQQMREGSLRAIEKGGEGATLGLLPHIIAGARALAGTPYQQGLQEARDFTARTSKDFPIGSMVAQGAGSLIPGMGALRLGAPLVAAAQTAMPSIGGPMARALLSGGLGAVSEAGGDIGSGNTQHIGSDMLRGGALGAGMSGAADLAGAIAQAAPNMAKGVLSGVQTLGTDKGRQGVAGQVLREVMGDNPGYRATPLIPNLELRAAQATGNPGLASLEDTLASTGGMQRGVPNDFVTNGRTPAQTTALAEHLLGSGGARVEPQVLVNQTSDAGVTALRNMNDALHATEHGLWSAPELSVPQINGPGVASGVAEDVARLPASWRDAITGPQNKLGAYLTELQDLGPAASVHDVNSVRSRLLGVARDAASGPQPDSVTAAAANRMAGHILDRVGSDPAIASSPQTMTAYQAARDYTRQFNQAKGYDEFNSVFHPNAQGNMQGNPETQFRQFFDTASGTRAGLQRLQQMADFARETGHGPAADALQSAVQDHVKTSIMRQARAGNGLDVTGQPAMNMNTLTSTVNKMMPTLNGIPMTAPVAGPVQAAGSMAELLGRPAGLGSVNSKTFERLNNNDLVSAIIGQSGSSALGAAAGGYAGYKAGDQVDITPYASIPAGMLAGAMAGRQAGPYIGASLSHIPGMKGAMNAPAEAIKRQLWESLANLPALNAAMATPMVSGPALGAPGFFNTMAPDIARAMIPLIANGGGR